MTPLDLSAASWRKSSRSANNGTDCVEAAFGPGWTAVRDSKNPDSAALVFQPGQWDSFIRGVKDDQFR